MQGKVGGFLAVPTGGGSSRWVVVVWLSPWRGEDETVGSVRRWTSLAGWKNALKFMLLAGFPGGGMYTHRIQYRANAHGSSILGGTVWPEVSGIVACSTQKLHSGAPSFGGWHVLFSFEYPPVFLWSCSEIFIFHSNSNPMCVYWNIVPFSPCVCYMGVCIFALSSLIKHLLWLVYLKRYSLPHNLSFLEWVHVLLLRLVVCVAEFVVLVVCLFFVVKIVYFHALWVFYVALWTVPVLWFDCGLIPIGLWW